MKKLSIILGAILISSGIYAVELTTYQSVKQRAMGSTTLLSEANENALVNNPALLNEIEKWEINILGMDVSVAGNTQEMSKGITSLQNDLDGLSENDIITVLSAYLDGEKVTINSVDYNADQYKLSNEKLVAEIGSVIAFAKKNFGFGVFTAVNVNELKLVNKPVSPEITVDVGGTVQIPVGFAHGFGDKGQYVLGTSIKMIAGVNARAVIDANDLAEDSSNIPITTEAYSGMALDLGAIWKTNYINYAMTINNVYSSVDTSTKVGDGAEVTGTDTLPLNINLAIGNKYHPKDRMNKWYDKHAFWTLELKNITSADLDDDGYKDDNFFKKIHFGVSEKVFDNRWIDLDLRAGLNQGYFTFGFGTEWFSFLNLDYAYSTRETGPHLGMKPETLHSFMIDFKI